MKLKDEHPACAAKTERGGKSTREGARTEGGGTVRTDEVKAGSGMKVRVERSREMETRIAEALAKIIAIKPTDPLRLAKLAAGAKESKLIRFLRYYDSLARTLASR